MDDINHTYLYRDKKDPDSVIVIGQSLEGFFDSYRGAGQLTERFIKETTNQIGDYIGELSFRVPQLKGYGVDGKYFYRSEDKRRIAWHTAENTKNRARDIENDSNILTRLIF
jgi:hypothetical protein